MNKRDFLKKSAGLGLASLAGLSINCTGSQPTTVLGRHRMKLSFQPYFLEMKHVFTVASNSRTQTPVMFTKITYGDTIGYGEASMPPYLGESHATAAHFLGKVKLEKFENPFELDSILAYVDALMPGNAAAKAAIDIALHDLIGKLLGQPLYNLFGLNPLSTPNTSFTIGIDKPEVVRQKTKEAADFAILKVKLGKNNDREMIETVRSVTDKPICVDVNQGWKDPKQALEMCQWLAEQNCAFVEQPMPKNQITDLKWLTERSPLPIVADEGIQRVSDVIDAYGVYSGINIKLMKCTGIREAHKMLVVAKALGMKVMLGCMVESSCAIAAGVQLSTLADWADLDGNLLIRNDPFQGTWVENGQLKLTDKPGLGVELQQPNLFV